MNSPAVIFFLLLSASIAHGEPKWVHVGSSGNEHLYIDPVRIKTITYPMGATGNIVGVLTPKQYKETWVTVVDGEGKLVKQYLWIFDCADRAGELAAVITQRTSEEEKSYDVTSRAQSIGVERYMQHIPPNSIYEKAQEIVCKR